MDTPICINCDNELGESDPPVTMIDPKSGERGPICESCDYDLSQESLIFQARQDNPWVGSWWNTREGTDF